MKQQLPSISVVTPTLNAEVVLDECLKRIRSQNYPQKLVEIIIADGGSIDKTLSIAKKYKAKIYLNPLKTAEAGKAVGVKKAKHKLVALIDSDNFLPTNNWFKKMVQPFIDDPNIIGSEPIKYTWRKKDSLITRYSALTGVNDPLVIFTGNYDRYNLLSGKWTEVPHQEKDMGEYFKITLNPKFLPTIGANGTILRKSLLQKHVKNLDYLFDIDIIYELVKKNQNTFAKVKIGIIHIFCKDTKTFIRKQQRRIKDFLYYNQLHLRKYPWGGISKIKLLKFIIFSLLIIPTLIQSIIGFTRKPDSAWFFHPIACIITLWCYGYEIFKAKFYKVKIADRKSWSQ